MKVTAEMAGTFVGLIFGGFSLLACLSALWLGERPDKGAVHLFGVASIVFFTIAGISIFVRILRMDSTEKRLRVFVTLVLGFVFLAADIVAMVILEPKLQGAMTYVALVIHTVAGVGGFGLFLMAQAFAK